MARIQQSIEIGVPVHVVYNQMTQFEDYPQFLQDVEAVQQLDDTHLHWTTRMSNRTVEWDAEITEQQPDRCIAWRNVSGPQNAGKVEVQSTGADKARVTLTLEAEPAQVPGSPNGYGESEMTQRLQQDLARMKQFLESRGSETGAWRGEVHDARLASGHAQTSDAAQQRPAPAQTSSFAAGSEGWDGNEDPTQPVVSASVSTSNEANRDAAHTADSAHESGRNPSHLQSATPDSAAPTQVSQPTTSEYALSRSSDNEAEDRRYSVAEEVNFDQQSDAARHVGQMPEKGGAPGADAADAADAMRKSMQQNPESDAPAPGAAPASDSGDKAKLKQSLDKSVPPSE